MTDQIIVLFYSLLYKTLILCVCVCVGGGYGFFCSISTALENLDIKIGDFSVSV